MKDEKRKFLLFEFKLDLIFYGKLNGRWQLINELIYEKI